MFQKHKSNYYIKNTELLQLKSKQYRIDNTEKIRERLKEKHMCVCGRSYSNCNKAQHMKSKKYTDCTNNHITLNITVNDGDVLNITTTK